MRGNGYTDFKADLESCFWTDWLLCMKIHEEKTCRNVLKLNSSLDVRNEKADKQVRTDGDWK